MGFRFFEAAAGGGILVGQPPETSTFNEQFGWADSVFNLPYDAPNLIDFLDDLESDPDRMNTASQRNIYNIMTRHDWCHRWSFILDALKLINRRRLLSEINC